MSAKRLSMLIFIAAFLVRFAALIAMRDIHKFHGIDQLGADAVEYNALGLSLARNHAYQIGNSPTAFRAVGFPLYLSLVYGIFGESYPMQYLGFCIMGSIVCVLTYWTGRKLGGERLARTAGVLSVFYVPHIYASTLFASENLFMLCLISGLFVFIAALRGSLWLLLLSGMLFGLGILTRPFLVLAMPGLAVLLLWHYRNAIPRAVTAALVLTIGCLALVAPWTWRNYKLFGRPVLVATNGGSTFYGANNDIVLNEPKYWGGWIATNFLPGRHEIDSQPDEVSHDAKEWQLGKEWVVANLGAMPKIELFKFVRFWLPDIGSNNKKYVLLQVVAYTPFLILFVAALVRRCRHPMWDTQWLIVDILMLSSVLSALIFWGSPRFRDGNAPILMLYAASALPMIPKKWLGIQET